MSSKSKRRPPIPSRPQLMSEQMRAEVLKNIGNKPRILNRQECMEFAVMVAANLEKLLNAKEQLPWIQASIEKRSDGFSLHVQVVEPSTETNVQVMG